MTAILDVRGIAKAFILHLRGGMVLPVVDEVGFTVNAGECVVLGGPSGAGKSSILKMVYGNYRCDTGAILIRDGAGIVDVATASPHRLLALRRATVGYVSQFLRVIPRISALEIVAAEARATGLDEAGALQGARRLLAQLNVPERLWNLPPATFSGGEQQRVNIARGFVAHRPLLLLDEPTASLDAANRAAVAALIAEKKRRGVAILGIFHDAEMRDAVADRVLDVTAFTRSAVMPPTPESTLIESRPS